VTLFDKTIAELVTPIRRLSAAPKGRSMLRDLSRAKALSVQGALTECLVRL